MIIFSVLLFVHNVVFISIWQLPEREMMMSLCNSVIVCVLAVNVNEFAVAGSSRSVRVPDDAAARMLQKLRGKSEFTIALTLKQEKLNSGVILSIHRGEQRWDHTLHHLPFVLNKIRFYIFGHRHTCTTTDVHLHACTQRHAHTHMHRYKHAHMHTHSCMHIDISLSLSCTHTQTHLLVTVYVHTNAHYTVQWSGKVTGVYTVYIYIIIYIFMFMQRCFYPLHEVTYRAVTITVSSVDAFRLKPVYVTHYRTKIYSWDKEFLYLQF